MSEVQNAIDKYLNEHPINIENAIEKFKNENKFKFLDDITLGKYTWGINAEKLYVKKRKIK